MPTEKDSVGFSSLPKTFDSSFMLLVYKNKQYRPSLCFSGRVKAAGKSFAVTLTVGDVDQIIINGMPCHLHFFTV